MYGKAYTRDMSLPREFSKRKEIRQLTDKNVNMLDIMGNRRTKKTAFITPPDVMVMPKMTKNKIKYHFKRIQIID